MLFEQAYQQLMAIDVAPAFGAAVLGVYFVGYLIGLVTRKGNQKNMNEPKKWG